jgi:hypothetical protein
MRACLCGRWESTQERMRAHPLLHRLLRQVAERSGLVPSKRARFELQLVVLLGWRQVHAPRLAQKQHVDVNACAALVWSCREDGRE